MPKGTHLRDVVNELSSLSPRQPLGPLASRLSTKIKQWYLRARKMVRGNSVTVTGSLQKSYSLWKEHLSFLPCAHRDRILSRIFDGVKMPWQSGAAPKHPIRQMFNGPELRRQRDTMWRTLREQLIEQAVRPWDVAAQGLPMGMSPIKCV